MKKKYGLYLVFAVLLMITVLIVHNKRLERTNSDVTQFAVKDTGEIDIIEIRTPEKALTLERTNNHWLINGVFPAGDKKLTVLLKLINRLQVNAPVPVANKEGIIEKLKKSGKRITVISKTRTVQVYLICYDTVSSDATYIMSEHSGQPYTVDIPGYNDKDIGRFFSEEVNWWRDPLIFRYQPEEIVSVSVNHIQHPENSFHLINSETGYKLFSYTDSTEVPGIIPERAEQYLSYFLSVSYESLLTESQRSTQPGQGSGEPLCIITLIDSGSRLTRVKTYFLNVPGQDLVPVPDLNRLIVSIHDTDRVVVKYVEFDPIMKDIGYFLEKEKNNLYN